MKSVLNVVQNQSCCFRNHYKSNGLLVVWTVWYCTSVRPALLQLMMPQLVPTPCFYLYATNIVVWLHVEENNSLPILMKSYQRTDASNAHASGHHPLSSHRPQPESPYTQPHYASSRLEACRPQVAAALGLPMHARLRLHLVAAYASLDLVSFPNSATTLAETLCVPPWDSSISWSFSFLLLPLSQLRLHATRLSVLYLSLNYQKATHFFTEPHILNCCIHILLEVNRSFMSLCYYWITRRNIHPRFYIPFHMKHIM